MSMEDERLSAVEREFIWLQGCRCVLGHTQDEDLISAAKMLVEGGFVQDELVDILAFPHVAVQPRFESALAELGLLPTREQAVRSIMVRTLHRMVKDRASLTSIARLISVPAECRELLPDLKPVCGALDCEPGRLSARQARRIWAQLDEFCLEYSKGESEIPKF